MKISVKIKLFFGFIFLIIIINIMGIITIVNLNKIRNAAQKAIKQTELADYGYQIEVAILECRRAEKNFLLRFDKKWFDFFKNQHNLIKKYIMMIKQNNTDKILNEQINKIDILVDKYSNEFITSVETYIKMKKNIDKNLISENTKFATYGRELQGLLPQFIDDLRIKMKNQIKISDNIKVTTIKIIVISLIISSLFGIFISFLISTNITMSINKFMQTIDGVKKGNKELKADIKSGDEFEILADYFNSMLDRIKNIIEEQRKLQQQVYNADKLAFLGRLGAGIAHEINNPLTGILTYAHMLSKKLPKNFKFKDDLKIIVDETIRCREIVKGLLDFARQTTFEKEYSDINEIIDASLSLVKNQPIFYNIKIIKKLQSGLPSIFVDKNQIQQVFLNIILNAQEAMPNGGNLTIETFSVDDKIHIKFIDNGCGISTKDINRIFDPFFTTKEKGKGTGLGLAVSYGIIKSHEGDIKVESKIGEGTTILIILPIKNKDNKERRL